MSSSFRDPLDFFRKYPRNRNWSKSRDSILYPPILLFIPNFECVGDNEKEVWSNNNQHFVHHLYCQESVVVRSSYTHFRPSWRPPPPSCIPYIKGDSIHQSRANVINQRHPFKTTNPAKKPAEEVRRSGTEATHPQHYMISQRYSSHRHRNNRPPTPPTNTKQRLHIHHS